MKRTWFGLNVRAVGEHPQAAETAGVSVARVRYSAMAYVGVLAALGGATLVFGATDALQLRLQANGLPVPHELLLMLPYLLTIVVLAGLVGSARYPSAAGVAYKKN